MTRKIALQDDRLAHGRERCAFSLIAGALLLTAGLPVHAQDAAAPSGGAGTSAQARQAPDKFMIAAFDVSGATKLSGPEIERLIYPFVGPDRSNADVVAAQKALQDAYAAKGYGAVLVDVPVQPAETFSQGIVQIAVNEAPVGRVRVVGSEHHALSVVREQVPSLVEGQPVDLQALQRDVAQANRVPDRSIDPVFRPGQVAGTIDVDLKVDDSRPYHASAVLNNDSSPSTKPLRLAITSSYTDLWQQGHSVSITYSVAPEDRKQSEVISASYNAPLIGTPWAFTIYGYRSNSNVAALGGTNVLGNGTQIGLRATYRLSGQGLSQQISFGPDFNSFKERLFLLGSPLRPTPIRYMPLVAEYSLSGADEDASFDVSLGVTAGLRVVKHATCVDLGNAQVPDQAAACRLPDGGIGVPEDQFQGRAIDARENFVHFNLDANYTQTLPGGLALALRLSGQLADSSLVTNEQFSIGGMTTVRGYYVSEAVGDDGYVESVELRFPDIAGSIGRPVDELRLFAFGDLGYAHVRAPAPDQQANFRIGSFGGGMRFRLLDNFSGEFLVGVPVTDGPVSQRGDARYSFSVKGDF
jgi:hemolysin activation/secretion protein